MQSSTICKGDVVEDLIVLGKVISITDDIHNPKLSERPPHFMDAIVEIHKLVGGRFTTSYKDIYDTTPDAENHQRPSVIAVQFATEWKESIQFQVDQTGVFVLTVYGKKKFLAKNFDQYWNLDEPF